MNAQRYNDRPNSLKSYYTINIELGLIASLSVLILAFHIPYNPAPSNDVVVEQQEVVTMEEVIQTKHIEHAPAPPKPVVPVAVPNSEVFEEEVILFDSELDLGEAIELPNKPPAPPEEESEKEEQIFMVVEQMPELVGGMQSVSSKIEYPPLALKAGIEGRVIVQFVVNERGQVIDPEVIRGVGGGCDEEALRVVKQLKFTPGTQRGKPVKVKFTLPVVFKIN